MVSYSRTRTRTRTGASITTKSNFITGKEAYNDALFDRKVENVTEGLGLRCGRVFYEISCDNALTIISYILSMKTEINPADNYRRNNIILLTRFSTFHNGKAFKQITREDVLSFR